MPVTDLLPAPLEADPTAILPPTADATSLDEPSKDPVQELAEAARRLAEELAAILQKLQESSPEERQALIDALPEHPVVGNFLETLAGETGQTVPQLLAEHSPEELFAPIQKVLPLLTADAPATPGEFGDALEQAFQESPFFRDLKPAKTVLAFTRLVASVIPTPDQPGQAATGLTDDPAAPDRDKGVWGLLQKLVHAARGREKADKAGEADTPPTSETAQVSSEGGKPVPSLRSEAAAKAAAAEGHPNGKTQTPSALPSQTQPATAATTSTAPATAAALTSETAGPSRPEARPASDLAAAVAAKAPRAVPTQTMGGQTSQGWNLPSGDRAPDKSASHPARPADPIRGALFSQIVEKAEMFKVGAEKKVLTVQLSPESLGKLNVELTSKDGAVTARISTEHAMVREKLEQIVPQIKETLAAQGINLHEVTVDISHQHPDGRNEEAFRGHGGTFRSVSSGSADASGPVQDVRPALRRLALNIRMVDLTV
ncbi:MAG: flagellar hook-length control protein FliK [Candidatus Riflebacteria bacterium]|nr:flagellar hook-length control protein FliK [Candidatus Riflebacteria bacterium]